MTARVLVLDKGDELHRALSRALRDEEVLACHQTAQAGRVLAERDIEVLVAGPSSLGPSGIRFLQHLHETRPDLIIVLVTTKDGPELPARELVRIGGSDLVRFPSSAPVLRAALERALEMATSDSLPNAPDQRPAAGRVITVTSPTGGCGKTFFATNLAYELATRSGKRVALVDLDLQFGEVSTGLRLRPEVTVTDLVANTGADAAAVRAQLRDFMIHHPSGVDVLAAPDDPSEADRITSPDVTRVVQAAREQFHYVIVDTPAALTETVLAAFDLSEALVVMATLDLPSVKNLGVFLSTLERLRIPAEGISLVMNKAESDVGLSTGDVQRLFQQEFKGNLPYSKEVSRSVNSGHPVLESARRSDIGQALTKTIRRVLPDESTLGAEGPVVDSSLARRPALLARLLGRTA